MTKPIDAKIEFNKRFPNIDLNEDKSINNYIQSKYREACILNDEKIKNTDEIFNMKDDKNNCITQTFSYYEEDDIEKK